MKQSSFLWTKETPTTIQYLSEEGRGTLFLTSKRLIFNGVRNLSFPFDKIADLKFLDDGLAITKGNDSIKFFQCTKRKQLEDLLDMFSVLLEQEIKEM